MNAEQLRDAIEDELFPLAPYFGSRDDVRHLPDAVAMLAITGSVVLSVLWSLLQAYGYDLIKPKLKQVLPRDELEAQIAEICHHVRRIKPQPDVSLERVREAVMECLKEWSVPEEKARQASAAIIARIERFDPK